MTIHGALVDVGGVGVLLLGPSGVGKSECALELVSRGHRLVADDVVEFERLEDGGLRGRAPERIRHHLEIRGLGILFIPDLFGPERVGESIGIDLVCRLERWRDGAEYDRLGLDRDVEEILGVEVSSRRLPARPGASMATIVEVAAREHLLRAAGENAIERLDERVRRDMGNSER
jgi:HPr kinase/phosphorylase